MKIKFKSIISGALCGMLLTSFCFGAALDDFSITESDTERLLTIEGTPENINKGEGILVEILKEDLSREDIPDSLSGVNLKDYFILIKQVPADENGGYSLTADMKGNDSGYYTIRVNGEDIKKYIAFENDKDLLIEKIKEICTKGADETESAAKERAASELKALFKFSDAETESDTELFFDINKEKNKVVYAVDEKELAEKFYLISADLKMENIVEKINLAACIQALNEDKIGITDYKTELGLSEKHADAYDKYIIEENKKSFVSKYFKNKNYETKESVQEAFNKAVIDSWSTYFSSWADVKKYIEDFGEEAGVDMTTYNLTSFNTTKKSELHTYIARIGGFSGTLECVAKINEKIDELKKPSSQGGSGGSSGGGGGGSFGSAGGTTVTKPIVSTDVVPVEDKKEDGKLFSDTTGFEWAEESIKALAEKGIVTGTGDGKFEPERNVTREEILVMLLRAFEVEIGEEKADFTDAKADGWYTSYLAAAKSLGFISGRPDGSFGVGDAVSRQDAAVMAYNIAKAKGIEFSLEVNEEFADNSDISDYALDAIYALKNSSVLNGKGDGLFAPKASCTRAEAAKIIYTLISK